MSAISLRSQPALARAAARFAVVGLLGTLLDMSLFAALHLALGLAALPANALSYSAGILNNFLLHRRWTYANPVGPVSVSPVGQVGIPAARASEDDRVLPLTRAAARDGRPTGMVGQVSAGTSCSAPAARVSEDSFLMQFAKFAAGPSSQFLKQFSKFAAGPSSQLLQQFIKFAAVSLTALALNTFIVILLAPALRAFLPDALAALSAKACATAAGMAWNFLANHWWTFRDGA